MVTTKENTKTSCLFASKAKAIRTWDKYAWQTTEKKQMC